VVVALIEIPPFVRADQDPPTTTTPVRAFQESIIDFERKLVRDAIAELENSDADAVLAAWPAAVRHLEPREARREARKKGGGTDKPN
jgi:hypothetical protein